MGILLIALAVFFLLRYFGFADIFNLFPTVEAETPYVMLFVIGLLTSIHCVAMCGGINISQCLERTDEPGKDEVKSSKSATLRPSFLYNLGRLISYTVVGAVVGALGMLIMPTGAFRGIIQLLAGAFMVVMGIRMLGIFPWLNSFSIKMPKAFTNKVSAARGKSKSPLIIGLLNGLMPCGPLQAMQIYALSTGSVLVGALSMFLFALGTIPLMFILGAVSSLLSRNFAGKLTTIGAALVVVFGLSMFSYGFNLSGFSLNLQPSYTADANSAANANANANDGANANAANSANNSEVTSAGGYTVVKSTLSPGRYPDITLPANTPVKWEIEAPEGSINGCNNALIIPEYNIEHKFKTGENLIEFTPDKTGKFSYSCWMGMIRGSITVTEAGGSGV